MQGGTNRSIFSVGTVIALFVKRPFIVAVKGTQLLFNKGHVCIRYLVQDNSVLIHSSLIPLFIAGFLVRIRASSISSSWINVRGIPDVVIPLWYSNVSDTTITARGIFHTRFPAQEFIARILFRRIIQRQSDVIKCVRNRRG